MKLTRPICLAIALLACGLCASLAQAQDEQQMRIEKALASPERSDEAKSRDEGRKPLQVIQFLGIKTGDKVVDVIAGGDWYTEVLSAAVGPQGKVYSQNPPYFTGRPGFLDSEQALVGRLGNVQPIHGDLPDDIVGQADAAITALNFHDIYNHNGEDGAVKWLEGVYQALKPGGVFGVIDHIGIEGQDNTKLHRVPIAVVRDVLEKAGFTIEAESDLLRNPDDDHTRYIRAEGLRWHTDRMLIRARKPM